MVCRSRSACSGKRPAELEDSGGRRHKHQHPLVARAMFDENAEPKGER